MKNLLLPTLVLASLLAGAGAASALRDRPKLAESGHHAVVVQRAVTLSQREAGEAFWHSRPVNEALVQLAKRGLSPVQITAMDDDTVLILLERDR